VKFSYLVGVAVLKGDPVYWTGVNDRVGKGRADTDSKSRIIGLAELAQASIGDPAPIVSEGPAVGVIAAATAGTPYYLQDVGGIGTGLPSVGSRLIMMGWAMNATDLFVHPIDYGKLAA